MLENMGPAFWLLSCAVMGAGGCQISISKMCVLRTLFPIIGVAVGILNMMKDTREFGNSVNLWIGLSPAETFFYVFLPPLLLDSAVRIDFFVFKKVCWWEYPYVLEKANQYHRSITFYATQGCSILLPL